MRNLAAAARFLTAMRTFVQRFRPIVAGLACISLASCGGSMEGDRAGDGDGDGGGDDAAAVAAVERAQTRKPPPRPISLQPILFADIQRADLFGAGCVFKPGRNGAEPVMIAQSHEGYIKLEGDILTLAPDTGGAQLPLHSWARYTGLELSLELTKAQGEPVATGYETSDWPGHLTARDEFGQTVYDADGTVQCGS